MTAKELIFKLADGYPEAMCLLLQLLDHKEFEIVKYFEREGIHGAAIIETFREANKDFHDWIDTFHWILALHYGGEELC